MSSWRSVAPLGAVVSLVMFVSAPAEAQLARALAAPTPRSEWHLDVHGGTALPLAVGLGLRLETPGRFLVDVWAGGVPDGYADMTASVATDYGASSAVGALLRATTTGAAVMRLAIGVRPIENAGLELLAGYTLFYAAPDIPRRVIEAATGQSLAPAGETIGLDLAVHSFHLQIDYAFVLFDHVVLRLGVGVSVSAAASARFDVPEAMRRATPLIGQFESDIASTIPGRVFLPELGLLAGARF